MNFLHDRAILYNSFTTDQMEYLTKGYGKFTD